MENIYPIFEKTLQRSDRESLLKQRGIMIWFTGLSGSGKSTLAIALERELYKQGILCRILDGDNIRSGINNNPRLLGSRPYGKYPPHCRGFQTIRGLRNRYDCSLYQSHQCHSRNGRRNQSAQKTSLKFMSALRISECEKRDVKGLYAKCPPRRD